MDAARHKLKLIPEIEKVESGMKAKTKTNAQGRTVNYGNGVSIDTDDVIYLEGPDFHSYTFRINHENAPADAPVENLVISSRPDGTWKEVLVTYYLTPQEKQNMLSGVAVDFTGKVTHEVLQNGTYSSAMMQGMQNCYWEVSSYYTRCGGKDDHHNGELPVSEGGPCETDTPSVLVVTLVEKCTIALPADTNLGENGEGGGGGPQNGPGGLGGNPPEETITAPNVPLPPKNSNPCNKIKFQRDDLSFQGNISNLQSNTGLKKETGYIQRNNGEYTYKDNATATDQANELALPKADEPENKDIIAYLHTHVNDFWYTDVNGDYRPKQGIKIFSPADINYFMKMVENAQDAGRPLGDVYAIMVTSKGNYQLRFTGNQYQIKVFTDPQITAHRDPFSEFMKYKREKPKDLEFGMLKYMEDNMNLKGISLYRMNSDGTNTEIKLNSAKTDREEINCSN